MSSFHLTVKIAKTKPKKIEFAIQNRKNQELVAKLFHPIRTLLNDLWKLRIGNIAVD